MLQDDPVINVRRHWQSYQSASYRLSSIESLHWSAYSGGVVRRAPREFLHGYVMCDGQIGGEVAHSGIHGPCPHRIKVCIVKADNRAVFPQLLELYPRPASR